MLKGLNPLCYTFHVCIAQNVIDNSFQHPTYWGSNPSSPFIRSFVEVMTPFITRLGAHLVGGAFSENLQIG